MVSGSSGAGQGWGLPLATAIVEVVVVPGRALQEQVFHTTSSSADKRKRSDLDYIFEFTWTAACRVEGQTSGHHISSK